MITIGARCLLAAALLDLFSISCQAALSSRQLEEAKLSPAQGASLPIDQKFLPSSGGEATTLADAMGAKPTALILADYTCRFICGTTLAIVANGLSRSRLKAGRDYSFTVVGINPKGTPADAEVMKRRYLEAFPSLQRTAIFLTGDAPAIARVTNALGYHPIYDAERDEFAHPVGVVILTAEGRVSRVIGGLNLNSEALQEALIEARQSRLSSLMEGIRLLCYGHSPLHGAYNRIVQAGLTVFGLFTLAAVAAAIAYLSRRRGSRL